MALQIPDLFASPPQAPVPVIDNDLVLVAFALALIAVTIVAAFVAVPWLFGQ